MAVTRYQDLSYDLEKWSISELSNGRRPSANRRVGVRFCPGENGIIEY
jgi:hypothetical protein